MAKSSASQTAKRRYEVAEAILRDNITEGLLPEGLVLLEGPIAEILHTSRAPVQRALVQLEADGLIQRTDFGETPPRVEYRLTDRGEALMPVLIAARQFGEEHERETR